MAHDIELRNPNGFNIALSTVSVGAVIDYFNTKMISLVSAINGKARSVLDKYNNIDLPTVAADSIELSTTLLNFTTSGGIDTSIQVTSSSSWTASVTSDPDNIIVDFLSAGDDQDFISVEVGTNTVTTNKTATILYTCGTATVELSICQDGTIETCG